MRAGLGRLGEAESAGLRGMRICIVSRCAWTLYNFRAGLIRALLREGMEVVGAGAGGDGFESKIRALGIPFCPLPLSPATNPLADMRLLWSLVRLYRQQRPGIVHHFTIKPVIYGSLAARLAKVPRVINTVTGLGSVFVEGSSPALRLLVERLYRIALKGADLTFFQNAEDLEYFLKRKLVSSFKAGLLPGSGVDCHRFAPVQPSSTREGVVFLMVARLIRDKGVYEFIEAARLVLEVQPRASFQLLGAPDDRNPTSISRDKVEAWIQEGIVTWFGEVEDVRPFIADADVVVLPSYREGVPRSLLEAAAMAKPLIATDVPGCREVVEHGVTGLLVPPRNAKSLANAMGQMILNPAMRLEMGKNARQKVKKEFSEDIVIDRILKVYEALQ